MASNQPNPSSRFPGSIRKRSKRACEPCRRRKTKCDGQLPCRNCREWEFDCSYEEQQPSAQRGAPPPTAQPAPLPVSSNQPSGAVPATFSTTDTFYEPTKRRFYGASSAVSFPRALAVSLHATAPPRIHSFAYNCGIVDEHFFRTPSTRLSDLIERRQAERYIQRYTEVVTPVLAWPVELDMDGLWSASSAPESEMLACFVVLLGAFFSWPSKFDQHEEVLRYAQVLLDQNNFHDAPSILHFQHAQAWILRTLYLRCITRPNITWISSSITMQVMESLGLHRELDTLEQLNLNSPSIGQDQTELRRKVFWTAWAMNRLISFEIGRSAAVLFTANTKLPTESNVFITAHNILYDHGEYAVTSEPEVVLSKIASTGIGSQFLSIVVADIACGVFRELYRKMPNVSDQVGRQLSSIIGRGLEACRRLCEDQQPWWFLTSMPFQFICVAVAVGKEYILDQAPEAMSVLQQVSQTLSTHMTMEACSTARQLLQTSIDSKDRELNIIRQALALPASGLDLPSLGIEEQDWGLFSGSQLNP